MAMKLEQRLSKLEDEVKALKATYNIYGGLVRCYLNSYSVDIPDDAPTSIRVRFTPITSADGKVLIFGYYYNVLNHGVVESLDDGYIDVQSSNGEVTINIAFVSGMTVNISLLTPAPGTFTRIQ